MILPIIKPIFKIAMFIASLILYGLTILAAYGGRFNPDIFTFPGILTLALPYFAITTLVVTIAWFATRNLIGGAMGVLAIIASWSPISSAVPLAGSKDADEGAKTFSVMTYNLIHGIDQQDTTNRNINGIPAFEYILNSGADIVAVQELIHINDQEIPGFTPQLRDSLKKVYPYWGGDEHVDMKVFSKFPIKFEKQFNRFTDDVHDQRHSIYTLNVDGRKLTLVNVHLRSFNFNRHERDVITGMTSVHGAKESMKEMKTSMRDKMRVSFQDRKHDAQVLREIIDNIQGPLILCGDFNDVPESYAWRLLKGDDLNDAYCETGFGPLVTYNQHMFWFHLDQIFYRGNLKALSVKKGKLKASDHYPLIAEFEFTPEALRN